MADQTVTTSERLWSEECAIADASGGDDLPLKRREIAYELSNGRKFYDPDQYPFEDTEV